MFYRVYVRMETDGYLPLCSYIRYTKNTHRLPSMLTQNTCVIYIVYTERETRNLHKEKVPVRYE